MSENNLLKMSSSPHIRSKITSSNIMLLVVVALLSSAAFGVWNFGLPALIMLILFLALAFIVPVVALRLFNNRSVVERLRVNE